MAVKEIVTNLEAFNDRADEVDCRKDNQLVRETTLDLKHTIRENNLVALTAPQIGVNKRIVCINFKGDIRTFINPAITEVKGFQLHREKCPSIPGKEYIRPRYPEISVMYQTPLGKIESRKFMGLAAFMLQYAIDILDGLVLSDIGLEIDELWDKATDEERDQVLSAYLESLDIKKKSIDIEIDKDEDAKQLKEAINFMESVAKGETKVETIRVDKDGNPIE